MHNNNIFYLEDITIYGGKAYVTGCFTLIFTAIRDNIQVTHLINPVLIVYKYRIIYNNLKPLPTSTQ